MHLRFCIFCNWRSCVLFGFKLWYCALLHFLCVVFVMCVVGRTMKQKSLESIARSITKSKLTLLRYISSNRSALNVEPLWLVYDFMPLPFDGNSPWKPSRPIVLGPHFLEPSTNASPSAFVANVIAPLPSLETISIGGPLFIFSFLFMQHFFLGCFSMQLFCFRHLGNPIRMATCMLTLPWCRIWLLIWVIWVICLIQS